MYFSKNLSMDPWDNCIQRFFFTRYWSNFGFAIWVDNSTCSLALNYQNLTPIDELYQKLVVVTFKSLEFSISVKSLNFILKPRDPSNGVLHSVEKREILSS